MAPRPPESPDRDAVAADELAHYDTIANRSRGKFGVITPYNAVLLNSPPFGAALAGLGRLARTAGDRENSFSHADREFVDQVLSTDWGTNVVLRLHLPDAVSAGVRVEAIRALREGREEELTVDERLLATYIRQVTSGSVADETFEAIVRRLGVRGTVEYTIFIGFLQMTIRMWQAFGLEDPEDAEIAQLLNELQAGVRAVPDFRERIG